MPALEGRRRRAFLGTSRMGPRSGQAIVKEGFRVRHSLSGAALQEIVRNEDAGAIHTKRAPDSEATFSTRWCLTGAGVFGSLREATGRP